MTSYYRLRFGRAKRRGAIADYTGRVEIYIEVRDLWIGAYVSSDAVYVCPLPCLVIRIAR
jgi:hypothetical protein